MRPFAQFCHLLVVAAAVALLSAAPALAADVTAPTTTSDAPTGWQSAEVTVQLTATDAESGVRDTYWRIDGGAITAGTVAVVPGSG